MKNVILNNVVIVICDIVVLHKDDLGSVGVSHTLGGLGSHHNVGGIDVLSVNGCKLVIDFVLVGVLALNVVANVLNCSYGECVDVVVNGIKSKGNSDYVKRSVSIVAKAEVIGLNTLNVDNAVGEVAVGVSRRHIVESLDEVLNAVSAAVKTAHKIGVDFGTPEVSFNGSDGLKAVDGLLNADNAVFGSGVVDVLDEIKGIASYVEVAVLELEVGNRLSVLFNELTALYLVLHRNTKLDRVLDALDLHLTNLSAANGTNTECVGSVGGFVADHTGVLAVCLVPVLGSIEIPG